MAVAGVAPVRAVSVTVVVIVHVVAVVGNVAGAVQILLSLVVPGLKAPPVVVQAKV